MIVTGAEVKVPKELADLAGRYTLQAAVHPSTHREASSGHVKLRVAVLPLVHTAIFEGEPMIYFEGSEGDDLGLADYAIGVGRERTLGGGVLIHVHYEDFSERGRSIIGPLKARYEKALRRPMPEGAPWGVHDTSNELFRHVPGSLETLAQVVFTTMKLHTRPVYISGH